MLCCDIGLVSHGVVWCGVVWCGEVWCGVVWCGSSSCGVVCQARGRQDEADVFPFLVSTGLIPVARPAPAS